MESKHFKVKAEAPFIIHDSYSRSRRGVSFNVALLKLSKPVDFILYPNIRPVCLPDRSYREYDGEVGVVTGWGDTRVEYSNIGSNIKGKSSAPANVLQRLNLR